MYSFTFTLTEDERERLKRFRRGTRYFRMRGMVTLLLFEILAFSAAGYLVEVRKTDAAVELIILSLLPLLAGLQVWIAVRRIQPQVLENLQEQAWQIDKSGLTFAIKHKRMYFAWSAITRVSKLDGLVTFEANGLVPLGLPKRVIAAASIDGLMRDVEYWRRSANDVPGSSHPASMAGELARDHATAPCSVTFPFDQLRTFAVGIALVGQNHKGGVSKRPVARAVRMGRAAVFGFSLTVVAVVFFHGLVSMALVVLLFISTAMFLDRLPRQTAPSPMARVPWIRARGLITVSMDLMGVEIIWNGGAMQTEWVAVTAIQEIDGDLVFSDPGQLFAHVPASAFFNPADKQIFVQAAEAYRRGETPTPDSTSWPPPPAG